MNESKNIVWLASYPKSGNTWFRLVLSYLLTPNKERFSINESIKLSPIYSSRLFIENETGIDTTLLSISEIYELRLKIYNEAKIDNKKYIKIHDAYTYINANDAIIPKPLSHSAVYFVRNPLDVAVSFAFHLGCDVSKAVNHINNSSFCLSNNPDKYNNQIVQKLLNWSEHIESWTNQKDFPIIVVRYEDMLSHTFEVFKKALNFININVSDNELKEALNFCSFNNLRNKEESEGFKEKAPKCEYFFRKGIAGDFINHLTDKDIIAICKQHEKMMHTYNYLPL